MLLEVNDSTFETEVLNSKGIVVVDYYSNSCAPCKRLMPKLENVSGSITSGKIVKVDVEHNFEASMRNKVKTIPTLIVYKNGEVVGDHRGCSQLSESEIKNLLEQ